MGYPSQMRDPYQVGTRAVEAPADVQIATRAGTNIRVRLSCRKPWTALRVKGLPCSILTNAFSASVGSDGDIKIKTKELIGVLAGDVVGAQIGEGFGRLEHIFNHNRQRCEGEPGIRE